MPLSTTAKALSSLAAVTILFLACRHTSASSHPAITDTPVADAAFGTRQPRKCPLILGRPSDAEAAVLLQCTMDYEMRGSINLMQQVAVTVGAKHTYDVRIDSFANDQDISQPMYAIHGSALDVGCTSSSNCFSNPFVDASGYCYALRGNAGYRCNFAGIPDRSQYKTGVPPPQTF